MTRYPTISVLMPVHNCEKYLRESIESILNQTYKDFEFIIINDGSTDKTGEILNEYKQKDPRIKIIDLPHSGIVTSLNRGLYEAKGEWIFRMDGDDISLSHRFSAQLKMVKETPSLILVGGWCEQINADGKSLKVNKYPIKHDDLVCALETLKQFFPHPSACYRREIVLKAGGYRERFRHAEDTDLWLRLSEYGKFACCKDVLIKLRKHPQNISVVKSHLQQLRSFAARVCYFRRKLGLPDPSKMDEEIWETFLKWVDQRLDEQGYFRTMDNWQVLKNIWYSNLKSSKLSRGKGLLKTLIHHPSIIASKWKRFSKIDPRIMAEKYEEWMKLEK